MALHASRGAQWLINWAKIAVAAGVFLEIVSPVLPDGVPGSPRTLTAAVGAALIVAGMYEGAPAPPPTQPSRTGPA